MLVADIVRRVRESAGDIGVLQFSNATLTDWINDAIREAVIENSLLQARATSATILNQTDYTLPTDIFKLHSVWIDSLKIEIVTLEQWEDRNAGEVGITQPVGTPSMGYVYAGVLTLSPTPDKAYTLKINYTKLPSVITFNSGTGVWVPDTPSIPETFHSRIVTYCQAQVALQDDDFAKYQALMAEFQTGVKDLKHASQQEEDLYPFMSISARDQGDWY